MDNNRELFNYIIKISQLFAEGLFQEGIKILFEKSVLLQLPYAGFINVIDNININEGENIKFNKSVSVEEKIDATDKQLKAKNNIEEKIKVIDNYLKNTNSVDETVKLVNYLINKYSIEKISELLGEYLKSSSSIKIIQSDLVNNMLQNLFDQDGYPAICTGFAVSVQNVEDNDCNIDDVITRFTPYNYNLVAFNNITYYFFDIQEGYNTKPYEFCIGAYHNVVETVRKLISGLIKYDFLVDRFYIY